MLAACTFDRSALDDVASMIEPGDFFRDSHAAIFDGLLSLRAAGSAADIFTLSDELRRKGTYDKAGGDETVDELLAAYRNLPGTANARYHAGIVLEKSITRSLMGLGVELQTMGYAGLHSASQLMAAATERLDKLASRASVASVTYGVPELALEAIERIHLRREGVLSGIPTGIKAIDNLTSGLNKGWMHVIPARPSMGKTALAIQIADNAASAGHGVLFFSVEMTRDEIAERLLIARSGVGSDRVTTHAKRLTDTELSRLGFGYESLKPLDNFRVDDSAIQTVAKVGGVIRREKARRPVDVVIVDYLQLMTPQDATRESRQEQVAKLSRGMQGLAKELDVALIVCAQLNRQADNRDDHRPRLSDLRESGEIEQNAHVVMGLHRPEYYDPNDRPGVAELLVLKNRNGPTGTIPMVYVKHLMTFQDLPPQLEQASSF